MFRPTLIHPTLWGLTAIVSQASASVTELTNALVCWMLRNPCNQQVPESCGKIPRSVGAVIAAYQCTVAQYWNEVSNDYIRV